MKNITTITDPDIIFRLKGIDSIKFIDMGLGVFAAEAGGDTRLNHGSFGIRFCTPRRMLSSYTAEEEVGVWMPKPGRWRKRYLFMVSPPQKMEKPFFKNRHLNIPLPYAVANINIETDSVSFCLTNATMLSQGRLTALFTPYHYPMSYRMFRSDDMIQTKSLDKLIDMVKAAGKRINDFKMVKQDREVIYFEQDLQTIR